MPGKGSLSLCIGLKFDQIRSNAGEYGCVNLRTNQHFSFYLVIKIEDL